MPNYPAGKIFPGYAGKWRMSESMDGIRVRRTWVYAGTGRSPFVRLANYFSFTFTALLVGLTGSATRRAVCRSRNRYPWVSWAFS